MNDLQHKKVAILATDGFEESELKEPKQALEDKGVSVDVVSLESGEIKGWKDGNWSSPINVDTTVDRANPDNYNALVIPGGVINPDKLRRDDNAVNFVKRFFESHKPVAAICHGPQVLIEADVVSDRKLTSFRSVKTDLINAGANWVDQEVVVDHGLVTSRTPNDLEAFNAKLLEELREGKHAEQTA